MKIGGKQFLNIQEAVGWLLANNALPFQSTSNFVADTEIAKSTIINPSPAEIRVGALVLFADRKVGTVSGITSNAFMVGAEYTDFTGSVYITSIQINQFGHLIFSLSDGTTKDAGLIKQIQDISLGPDGHLYAFYNDGTSEDLGGLFDTNISMSQDLSVAGDVDVGGDLDVTGDITATEITATTNLGVTSNASVGGELTVTGQARVGGDTQFDADVNILGTTNLGDADIGGNLTVSGESFFDNDVQINGDAKFFENIVDKDGHKRFIEGDISLLSGIEINITKTYGKWSLSGSHLLIVLGLSLPDTLVIASGRKAVLTLPQWVYDKIAVLFSSSIVDYKGFETYADDYSSQTLNVYLQKFSDNRLALFLNGLTLTKDRKVRIAFDLLIDNE